MNKFFALMSVLLAPAMAGAQVLNSIEDSTISSLSKLLLIIDIQPTRNAKLSWQNTVSATDGYFVVERRSDSSSFENIQTIRLGKDRISYQATDENPFPGLNYYRLKLVTSHGITFYSQVVSGDLTAAAFCRFYPNPADDHLIVSTSKKVEIQIFSSAGNLLLSRSLDKGIAPVDLTILAKGLYILAITNSETKSVSRSMLYKN